ncbi:PREDICTED: transcription termination factor MTERF5, chloroplastic-like [Ipomoea nil]|uniref:transcription termination factor MTERF5, chloroplastic-like n=1 Tax=Ipomoea nil TaxID=35883 RepID=UPI000901A6DA|nr:PREDICTED: transcription termination factor MTERF5, chloroplastic-like [Ipomoea nil]
MIYFAFFPYSVESTSNNAKRDSFTVSYLINRCGFTPKKALSASKYINFKTPNRAESVLSFLKNHGFSETQALKIVRRDPTILTYNPEKSFLPKLEFLKSLGFPGEHLTHILCVAPSALRSSLERRLLPTIGFLENLLLSRESMRVAVRRYPNILSMDLKAHLEPNVQLLKEMGVPEHKIVYFLTNQPLTFMMYRDKFRKILEELKELGIDPTRKNFLVAFHALACMSKLTWEKKMEGYRKWGLAENEIFEAFSRNPWFMIASQEKVLSAMDFFVNKMGFESSAILKKPMVVLYSLEKRIIPRGLVYQTLLAKGLIRKDLNLLAKMLKVSEAQFVEKFVEHYKKEAPELIEMYRKLLIPTITHIEARA